MNQQLIEMYHQEFKFTGFVEKTIKTNIRHLNEFEKTIDMDLTMVSSVVIENWLAYLNKIGYAAATIESKYYSIKSFYIWLQEEDLIESNPALKVRLPIIRRSLPKILSDSEIQTFRKAARCDSGHTALIETLLCTGIRTSEIANLKREDYDSNSPSITILKGKGHKDRISYITALCAERLDENLSERVDDLPNLFVSHKGRALVIPMTNYAVRSIIRNYVYTYGLDSRITPRTFRYTFGTSLAEKGFKDYEIACLMGHTRIKTTKLYINLSNKKKKEGYDKYTNI